MDEKRLKPIPKAVLQLLAQKWRPDGLRYDSYRSNFTEDRRDRQVYPSYYIHGRSDKDFAPGWDAFKASEIAELVKAGVLEDHSREGRRIVVNEHEEHALDTFLRKTYEHWLECCERIEEARSARRDHPEEEAA